jgi:hypothetical protein
MSFVKDYTEKAYEGVEVKLQSFLAPVLYGGE